MKFSCIFLLLSILFGHTLLLLLRFDFAYALRTLSLHTITKLVLRVLIWKGNKTYVYIKFVYCRCHFCCHTDFISMVFCRSTKPLHIRNENGKHFSPILLFLAFYSMHTHTIKHFFNFFFIFIFATHLSFGNIYFQHYAGLNFNYFSPHLTAISRIQFLFLLRICFVEIDFSWFNYCIPINSFTTIDLERVLKWLANIETHITGSKCNAFQTQMAKNYTNSLNQ